MSPRPERTVQCRIGDKVYGITSDDAYLEHIGAVFEPAMCRLYSTLILDTDTVMDIGANIGCTSILFSTLADKVLAFEPSPTTFKLLERNIADAGCSNVELFNIGLGAKTAGQSLTFAPNNRSGGFVSDKTEASKGHTVETIDIVQGDCLLAAQQHDGNAYPIGFIKIDVEGYELHVIRGLRETIRNHRPNVVLEMNHWCLNAFQRTSIPDFLDCLAETFPVLYAIDGDRYADLHDPSQRYAVMHEHIVKFRFANVLGAFDEAALTRFRDQFSRI